MGYKSMKKFTSDEKTIAMNIDKKYKWMARDKNGALFAYLLNPTKKEKLGAWVSNDHYYIPISDLFGQGLFNSIKWEDDEPTLIKDIYDPQILDDIEREYIKFVLKPFHEEVSYVEKLVDDLIDDGSYSKEYLYVKLHDGEFVFPDFDKGKMYVGMEIDKKYKLDELGITYKDGENE